MLRVLVDRQTFPYLVNQLLVEAGELVDVLARVARVGDAEPKVKVKGFEVAVTEKVALNHPEILSQRTQG